MNSHSYIAKSQVSYLSKFVIIFLFQSCNVSIKEQVNSTDFLMPDSLVVYYRNHRYQPFILITCDDLKHNKRKSDIFKKSFSNTAEIKELFLYFKNDENFTFNDTLDMTVGDFYYKFYKNNKINLEVCQHFYTIHRDNNMIMQFKEVEYIKNFLINNNFIPGYLPDEE